MPLDLAPGSGGPYAMPDGKTLYFHAIGNDESLDIYRLDLNTADDIQDAVPLTSINSPNTDGSPVVTPDGLTIFFTSDRPDKSAHGSNDIWVASRRTVSDDFGMPTNVAELNTADDDAPSWVSPDGCRLYFDRQSVVTGHQTYIAERPMMPGTGAR